MGLFNCSTCDKVYKVSITSSLEGIQTNVTKGDQILNRKIQ